MHIMDSVSTIGIFGAIIVLASYFYNQTGKLSTKSYVYDLANLIGSSILVVYALIIGSFPFAILNFIWAGISLKDVFRALKRQT